MAPREPQRKPSVLLIGAGAIGAIVGARLAAKGYDITVACRSESSADRIQSHGLEAVGIGGAAVGQVRTILAPEELVANPEIVLLATKCDDAVAALGMWEDAIPPGCPIVAMQNGMMGDALYAVVGERLIESVVAFPATLLGPGRSEQTGPGGFHIGAWAARNERGARGKPSQLQKLGVQLARSVLRDATPVWVEPNIEGAKWTKLIINSCITTLGVVSGKPLGDLLDDPRARDAFLHITSEGYQVGQAAGIRFETVGGFRPKMFALPAGAGAWSRGWRHGVLRALARKYKAQRSSSLQSLERGLLTEVDHLNGVIVDEGAARGVATPVNAAAVTLVHAIEQGDEVPGSGHLSTLLDASLARVVARPLVAAR